MILGLFIIGMVVAVLALAALLGDARMRNAELERERDMYAQAFFVLMLSAMLLPGSEGGPARDHRR
jgi:hypothetical protein